MHLFDRVPFDCSTQREKRRIAIYNILFANCDEGNSKVPTRHLSSLAGDRRAR